MSSIAAATNSSSGATVKINLVVVRHGQTESNRRKVLQGQANVPLNATGREQARLAGVFLKDEPFDRAYTSDLSRASETASIILAENANPATATEPAATAVVETLLRERNFGVLENRPVSTLAEHAKKAGLSKAYLFVPKGGESPIDVRTRAKKFVQKLCHEVTESEPNDAADDRGASYNFLVVSHGGFIRELIGHLYEDHRCQGIPEKTWKVVTPNTGISKFEVEIERTSGRMLRVVCTLFKHKDHLGPNLGGGGGGVDDGAALFDERSSPAKGNNS